MLKDLFDNIRSVILAVLVHLVLIAMLIFSLDWTPKATVSGQPKVDVVKAVAVDGRKVEKELARIKEAETRKITQERRRQERLDEQARKAREARRKEEERLAETKRKLQDRRAKAEVEKERLAMLRKEQELMTEKKRQAEAARKKAEEEHRRAETERRAAEAARKKAEEKKRQAEIAKRKAEKARRKAVEDKRRKQAELAMQEELAIEQEQLERQRRQLLNQYQNEYISQIQAKVERVWLRPHGTPKGLKCRVGVAQIPGGEVISVRIKEGSGDTAFDQSVEKAVLKASPLPIPKDQSLFLREFDFLFSPED